MRKELQILRGRTADLGELWEIRKRGREKFDGHFEDQLNEFANEFKVNPSSVLPEDMSAAYKIFLMMRLVPEDPNPN